MKIAITANLFLLVMVLLPVDSISNAISVVVHILQKDEAI